MEISQNSDGNGLVLRCFTPNDYELWCAVNNAVYPEYPDTPDEIRHADSQREEKIRWGRFLAEWDGKAIGVASYGQNSGAYHPHRFHVHVAVLPEWEGRGIGARLYDHLMAHLSPLRPETLRAEVREDRARALRFAEARGFREVMREQESRLDLSTFAPETLAEDVRRVEEQGIVLRSLAEARESDPGIFRKLYDLNWEIHQDIPHTETLTRQEYDRWLQRFDRPGFRPEGYWIAFDGENAVGVSMLWGAQATPDLFTGMTGTLRAYRKRGIATALKVKALARAKQSGAPYVRTWNEINNDGMLGINYRLGFVRLPQWIEMRKDIAPAEDAAPSGKEAS